MTFEGEVVAAADAAVTAWLVDDDLGVPTTATHRGIMTRARVLVAVALTPASRFADDPRVIAAVERHGEALRSLQAPSGLFVRGDNVESPPDSGFTINDVCDAISLIDAAEGGSESDGSGAAGSWGAARALFAGIVQAATEAMIRGGVHTPNHRWELTAALARINALFPDERLVARAEAWLAEGIDISSDGFYSERSMNYAAHVTNPSLLAISRLLDRPDLRDVVERNLAATLELIRPDGTVETIQSRRQDQGTPFGVDAFLTAYRALAVSTGRGDLSWAAGVAAASGIREPRILTEILLDPTIASDLPAPVAPAARRCSFVASLGLASKTDGGVESVVFAGSDYPAQSAIRSGLANSPTFYRLFAGDAVLDSVRLSRSFFDLGPFRADGITRVADDRYRLVEEVSAAYYEPLAPEDRRAGGDYELADEGRFSAAMSFARRPETRVGMSTAIDVSLVDDGADLAVTIDSPAVPWAVELAFRPGGTFGGVESVGDDEYVMTGSEGSYRVGGDRIVFGASGTGAAAAGSALAGRVAAARLYHPGQEYTVGGGTDAARGPRVYVTGTAPSSFELTIRSSPVTVGASPARAEILGPVTLGPGIPA